MKKNRLLKQGLAVLLSLSMSLGPCAPGSFAAFADTAGVSSEVETGTDEAGTGADEVETVTEEETGAQGGEAASNDDAGEVPEDGVSDQEGEEPGAGESDGQEDGDSGAGENAAAEDNSNYSAGDEAGAEDNISGGKETPGESDGQDNVSDGEEVTGDDVLGGSDDSGDEAGYGDGLGDEMSSSGDSSQDGTAEDGSASEAGADNEGETSAADQGGESTAPEEGGSEEDPGNVGEEPGADEAEEADAASETAAVETETEAAPENTEIEAEGEVKTETRHVLQAEVDETIISVIYDDGVFPENVTLEVRKVDEDSAEQEEIFEIIKKSVDAEESNAKNEEEFPDGLIALSFEIKILDEEENEVQPVVDKGTVYIRLDHLEYPADETKEICLENKVRVFELTDISEGKIKELKNADAETDNLSIDDDMIPEGAVIDDINNRSETSEEDGIWAEEAEKTSFTANCATDRTVLRSKTDAERSERTP